jgi:UDP-N-acetyl-D-mannosaminuronic acid dehydrogenase
MRHVAMKAEALIAANPNARVACLGLAFKANIDDFRESPARLVASMLAQRFGERIQIVEPYTTQLPREFDGTGATLIDLDTALEETDILIVLVDHDVFRHLPLAERADKIVYDTRGIWPDQPKEAHAAEAGQELRLAS